MSSYASNMHAEISRLGLEQYVEELETNGLTVVPPAVTGVTQDLVDRCVTVLLERFTELTGCLWKSVSAIKERPKRLTI